MAGVRATDQSQLEQLATEHAALRRVAMLVAQGSPADTLFALVAEQVAKVLRVPLVSIVRYEADRTATERASFSPQGTVFRIGTRWSLEGTSVVTQVLESGRPARIDDYSSLTGVIAETARGVGITSTVGIPIVVSSRLWGCMVVSSTGPKPLPAETEVRLADFTELVGTAIANTEARDEVQRLADEQAGLRRVATLVAREASQLDIFAAIAEVCADLFGTENIGMARYESDRTQIVLASEGMFRDIFPVGSRQPLGGENAASRVFRTGRPARIDDYQRASGPIADAVRPRGLRCAVATPIMVEGRLWGAIITGTTGDDPLPPETEGRLEQFTELMATAIANTEAHARADRLAQEQAALRRVATLVAKEASPADAFAMVAEEVAKVFGDVDCALFRDEGDRTATAIAVWGATSRAGVPVGTRIPTDGNAVVTAVLREGRPCRIADYASATGPFAERARELGIRSAVGCPIVVGGRTWGAMAVARYEAEPFPPETETRIAQFSDLVATAIANAAARAEVERLADEQAALRRVATLVAEGASPTAVFDAVAAEMERLLDADQVVMSRYEPGTEVTVVAHRAPSAQRVPPGSRLSYVGENVQAVVRRTARLARIENSQAVVVGAPIVVDGRLWGVISASWHREESPPADTEERMARFAQLLDTAIANADSRDQLTASRARLLTTGDDARRRVVRDLHDGAQQRLVHTIITLKLAQQALRRDDGAAEALVREALEQAQQGNADLRELAHGILPSALAHGGLRAAVDSVVARLDLPVRVNVPSQRFPAEIEASAYFIVAEALTNVVKHAHAERAEVTASVPDGVLRIEVRDDGTGGADRHGHGLIGMEDRATALGGRLEVESPVGGGTLVAATLPLSDG